MRRLAAFAAAAALCAAPLSARALDFDFRGVFQVDNEVVLLDFLMEQPGTVTVFSSSWIVGNSSGVAVNGFDPVLGIWGSGGDLVHFQDDGHRVGSTLSNGVAYDHGFWDVYFTVDLEPGRYFASISQYDNFPVGYYDWRSSGTPVNLSAGFFYDDVPDFTRLNEFGPEPYFNGHWRAGDTRTGFWEFHVLNVAQAARVPEPSTLLLLGGGLVLFAVLWRKFRD